MFAVGGGHERREKRGTWRGRSQERGRHFGVAVVGRKCPDRMIANQRERAYLDAGNPVSEPAYGIDMLTISSDDINESRVTIYKNGQFIEIHCVECKAD
jgi:hypothetical protein